MFIQELDSYVVFGGKSIFTRSWTPENLTSNEPLILFHDSLGCVEMWRDFPKNAAEKICRKIIAYDRWGFGKSSAREKLPSLNFVSEEASDFEQIFIRHFGFSKFSLFGHSVGGAMALVCAARFPNFCTGVIAESTQAMVEELTLNGIKKSAADFAEVEMMERLKKYHGEKASWVLRAWTDTWLSEAYKNWTIKREVSSINCPLLAIHGDRDEFGSGNFPILISNLSYAGHSLIIENCGHVPHREKQSEVLTALVEFEIKKGHGD